MISVTLSQETGCGLAGSSVSRCLTGHSHLKVLMGGGTSKVTHLAGFWLEIAVPDHVDPAVGLWASTKESKRGHETGKPRSVCNLVLEVTSHHFATFFSSGGCLLV